MTEQTFQTPEDLAAHYRAVKARLASSRPPAPAPATQATQATQAPATQAPAKARVRPSRAKPAPPMPRVVLMRPSQETPPPAPSPTPLPARARARRIIAPILRAYDVTWDEVIGPPRVRRLIPARLAIYAALHNAGFSMKQIGRFCHRDHTTVLHYLKKWCGYTTTPRKDRYKVTL